LLFWFGLVGEIDEVERWKSCEATVMDGVDAGFMTGVVQGFYHVKLHSGDDMVSWLYNSSKCNRRGSGV